MMKTMKRYIKIAAAVAIIMGVLLSAYYRKQAAAYEEKYEKSLANMKAYESMFNADENRSMALQLTAEQMKCSRDSVIQELVKTQKKLGAKNVKSVQKITSEFVRTDTIYMDTIFKSPEVSIDTLIGDEWYRTNVSLRYPSTIILSPMFKSDKSIIVHTRRETVNPPKRLWILRLFQKKHTVLQVDVVERNPYVRNEKSRYVEILK